MNAEISAYSSGNLPKHEYLMPDAFEQAKFEYSPLGKIFTDGLDKSDRNEGLSKRLKIIQDRNNNQLLSIKNIPRPAIKGENNGGFRSDKDVNDEYKTIQNYKQGLIDKDILRKGGKNLIKKSINGNKLKIKKLFIKMLILKLILKKLTYITFLKTIQIKVLTMIE